MENINTETKETDEMKDLLNQQKQIMTWLSDVKRRIYETETTYLEETQLGNVIKGWEIDGRPPLMRVRGQCEDKERLFSYSSYETWAEQRQTLDSSAVDKKLIVVGGGSASAAVKLPPGPKGRKNKKRKSDMVDDWTQGGDY